MKTLTSLLVFLVLAFSFNLMANEVGEQATGCQAANQSSSRAPKIVVESQGVSSESSQSSKAISK